MGGVDPIGLYNVRGWSRCNPQARWLLDRSGLLVDDVWRVEALGDLAAHMRAAYGVESDPPRSNLGDYVPAQALYEDGAAVDRVRALYAEDFDLLRYGRDPADMDASPPPIRRRAEIA